MLLYPHPPALRVNAFRLSRSLHKITQQMTPSGFKNDLLWTCHENHRLHSQINNTLRQCQCHQNDTPAQVATVLPRQELLQSPSNPLVCRPISHERRSPERPCNRYNGPLLPSDEHHYKRALGPSQSTCRVSNMAGGDRSPRRKHDECLILERRHHEESP